MGEIVTLPGLIDLHVHLRDPGQTHKEDLSTGTSAALAGGFTTVVDMPNNKTLVTTESLLDEKINLAKQKAVCDIGFNFGTLSDNFDEFTKIYDKAIGLKVYLNITTGGFIIDKEKLTDIYKAWESDKLIFLHSEEDVSDLVSSVIKKYPKRTHICHISSKAELSFIMELKAQGYPITCGVTPHHLFLDDKTQENLGAFGYMKPHLKPKADLDFLWENLDSIDVIESDHAPHTVSEKNSGDVPFGVPGLETTLPLMLKAEADGKISREQILEKLHRKPAELIGIKPDAGTKIEVDMSEYEIKNEDLKTKCGWSPFAGRKVIGKIQKVYIRGNLVYENGEVLAEPGSGKIIN
ncbi:MAG TPA: amidohydrolase family protein [Candidatus Saccharimonadales bacterium]|nr:amidohydrolase family protein [Candidatus Saccharimonadales bacterium]